MSRTRRPRTSPTTTAPPEPEPAPAPLPPRAWLAPLAAVVLAWAMLFLPQLFLGQRFVLGDSSAFRPFPDFSRARWTETGARTHWNPYVFMGIESVASLADQRPQYLPDAALGLVERLHEPAAAPQLWLLLVVLAGTLAVVALARALWRAGAWSAAAAGLVWLLAVPILAPLAHGHDAQVLADALLPVMVLATWATVAADDLRARLAASLGLALALGLQCLGGHPQILVYSAALVLLIAVQQAWTRRRWSRLVPWGAAVALGAAIGAAVWWPALLYSGLSSRGGGDAPGVAMAVVAKYSLGWRDLVAFAWPQAVGFGGVTYWGDLQVTDYSPYLGAVALALALLGLRRGRPDPAALFWWVVLAAAAFFSLGATLGPVFELLHRNVPLWSKFRVPFYVLVWACLALALLVARGLSRAGTPEPAAARPPRALLVALGVVALLGLAIAFPLSGLYSVVAAAAKPAFPEATQAATARWAGLDLALRALLVAAAVLLLARARGGRAWAMPALVALVALDLATVAAPALWRGTGPSSSIAPPEPPALARLAAGTPHLRAFSGRARPVEVGTFALKRYPEPYTNFWVSWRARSLTGNHGAFPAAWRAAMEHELTRYQAVLRAWGVGWLDLDAGAPDSVPGLRRVAADAHGPVYAVERALGRAYAVTDVVPLPDADAMARAMALPGFDPASVAVTTSDAVAGSYPGSAGAAIRWVKDEPEEIVLEVDAPARAFVVVADSHFPGWRAWVDEVEADIAPVNLLVRGVAMPAGRHRLTMRYETEGLRLAVPVTRAGLGAWLVLALAGAGWALSRRRGVAPAAPGAGEGAHG
jgi:hypothetical protein